MVKRKDSNRIAGINIVNEDGMVLGYTKHIPNINDEDFPEEAKKYHEKRRHLDELNELELTK